MTVAAAQLGLSPWGTAQPTVEQLPILGKFPSLDGATGWLNSQPLTVSELRGKVVLVDFWTYTCINWRRTLPYIRAWEKRYKDRGLVVVGVHTPEFPFEHDPVNVRRAAKEMRIDYPIAMDNNDAIWRVFRNDFWPAFYFIDARGRIRYRKFGEGEYALSEMVIQQLLAENDNEGFERGVALIEPEGAEAPADWVDLKSSENYLGYERTLDFASPGGVSPNQQRSYVSPTQLRLNHWALAGRWTANKQGIVLNANDGCIVYHFHARDLHLVMGPIAPGAAVRFRVLIDGRPPANAHGADVDDQGAGVVNEPRMYQLIRQPTPIVDQQFEIHFLEPGVEAYSFAFG